VAAGKDIDPRFDAAFQRGGRSAQPSAQVAARNVDALREALAPIQAPAPKATSAPDGQGGRDPVSVHATAADTDAGAAGGPQAELPPQSHYVDDSGALADSAAVGRGASLARNPWIYVLWVVGIAATAGGIVGQLWSYLQFYTQPGLDVADYRLITAVQGLAPIAATVGAFFIVGALIIHALSWMRQHP